MPHTVTGAPVPQRALPLDAPADRECLLVVPVGDLVHDVIERRRVKAGPLDVVDGESPRSLRGSDQRIVACA